MIKERIAKVIRIASVPPVMITMLMLILYFGNMPVFSNITELILAIFLLGIIPVLAYPLQKIIPKYKESGRDGQRKLAFVATLIGYLSAFIWGLCTHVSRGLLLVISTYFFSAFLLTIFNKMIHFKASGHASSFTGPLLILIYFYGWVAVIPCFIVAAAISWSSVLLKRHTRKELIGGFMACLISFGISVLITTIW